MKRRSFLAALAAASIALAPVGPAYSTAQQMLLAMGAAANPTWATIASFTTARMLTVAVGTSTSAALIAGETTNAENAFTDSVQIWNDVSWSAGAVTTSARGSGGGAGTVTAALHYGGRTAITTPINSTIQGDATVSWSAGGNLAGTARQLDGSCGTQTSSLHVGGFRDGTGDLAIVESYNGTAWSAGTNLSAGIRGHVLFGVPNDALIAGSVAHTQATQGYNGTSWAAGQNMITGREMAAGAGTGASSGLIAGGYTGAYVSSAERFVATWVATSTSLSVGKTGNGCGTQNAALCLGGSTSDTPPGVTATAERFS